MARVRRCKKNAGSEGAAMLEFAIILPLLVILVFGIIEYGFFMAQHLEVRHAAREGVRLASVDAGNLDQLANKICDRIEVAASGAEVTLSRSGVDVGESASVKIKKPTMTLTGLLDGVINEFVVSEVSMRLERTAYWSAGQRVCA